MTGTAETSFPAHVAIVGCGFSGTSALFQLVERHPVRAITVFEATGDFGPGFPYRTDECADYLINNTTDSMCLTPENRRAFLNWLEARHAPGGPIDLDPKGHLPRAVFGAFLKDAVEAARTMAAVKGIALRFVAAEVTAMTEPETGGVALSWEGGSLKADAALLTTGRCPGLDPYPAPPPGGALYVADHISTAAFDAVPLDADVHILGASLSAYDVLNRLFSADTGCRFERERTGELRYRPGPNGRRAVLISRSGRLKKMESRSPARPKRTHFTRQALRRQASGTGLTLAQAAQAIERDAAENGVCLNREALLDPYRDCGSVEDLNRAAFDGLAEDIEAARNGGGANFLVDLATGAQRDLWAAFAENTLSPDEGSALPAGGRGGLADLCGPVSHPDGGAAAGASPGGGSFHPPRGRRGEPGGRRRPLPDPACRRGRPGHCSDQHHRPGRPAGDQRRATGPDPEPLRGRIAETVCAGGR